jgi:hypothetical protein
MLVPASVISVEHQDPRRRTDGMAAYGLVAGACVNQARVKRVMNAFPIILPSLLFSINDFYAKPS